MSNKKSETLKQREQAQRELIRLKKMQAGELEAPEKDKERLPETFTEKKENFFYYHKYKVIAGIVALVAAVYFIVSTVTATKYDATAVVFCWGYISEENRTDIADYLEQFHDDTDGNGEINVSLIDCSFVSGSDTAQYAGNMMTKIQTVLAADEEAMLFLLDEESLEYLNGISSNVTLFAEEDIVELKKGYTEMFDEREEKEKKRYLCLRTVDGTTLEGKAKESYKQAKKALDRLREAQ